MSTQTHTQEISLTAQLRSQWNGFARTGPGDMLATALTIAVMFCALFGCAFAIVLGSEGFQLTRQLFGSH
ncbi:MAG TPA: hypothetical protein VGK90_01525 [Rhizomicrobium sp.]|jgi:hypothetical protein